MLSDADADDRFEAYCSMAFTGGGERRKTNPYTAEAAKQAPQVVDFFQVKDAPQGREITRIIAIADALKARRIFERSAGAAAPRKHRLRRLRPPQARLAPASTSTT